jgi:inorganic pyrophosphatase
VTQHPVEIEVTIEIARWSCLKRGSSGHIDFISPLPCPYNYGAAEQFVGLDGDLLDALVLGPRQPRGTKLCTWAWGAITFTDRGMSDDKLICSDRALSFPEQRRVLRFFHLYARCKGLLNVWRRRPGRNGCDGWCEAVDAVARATPRTRAWRGPQVEF